jgi:hypothetical protein
MRQRKTHKKKTHKRKTKGGASRRTFRRKLCSIRQLSRQNDLPPELSKLIEAGYSQQVIETYIMKYRQKMRLKRDFTAYSDVTDNEYDPMDPQLGNLTRRATEILNRNDLNRYWKNVLAKIFMGLHRHEFDGGQGAIYYAETETNFIILLKILFNYDVDDTNYLTPPGNDFIFENFLHDYLEHGE